MGGHPLVARPGVLETLSARVVLEDVEVNVPLDYSDAPSSPGGGPPRQRRIAAVAVEDAQHGFTKPKISVGGGLTAARGLKQSGSPTNSSTTSDGEFTGPLTMAAVNRASVAVGMLSLMRAL